MRGAACPHFPSTGASFWEHPTTASALALDTGTRIHPGMGMGWELFRGCSPVPPSRTPPLKGFLWGWDGEAAAVPAAVTSGAVAPQRGLLAPSSGSGTPPPRTAGRGHLWHALVAQGPAFGRPLSASPLDPRGTLSVLEPPH